MATGDSEDSGSEDEFFDPEEEEVLFGDDAIDDSNNQIEAMLKIKATALNSTHNRLGARCPVPDSMPLIRSGGQVRWQVIPVVFHLSFTSLRCILSPNFTSSFMPRIFKERFL